ncbi:MAG: serine protease inhibitor [Oscillospiraceae bacterium]|nr:serine protease inhibitor [Oscillospiraceae bacterium]
MKLRKITAMLSALTLLTGSLTGLSVSAAAKGSGDVDENGSVAIADAILLARYIAEDTDITVTAQGRVNADMTGDDLIDADDSAALLSWLAGTASDDPQPVEGRSVNLLADIRKGSPAVLNPTDAAFRAAQSKLSADLLRQLQNSEEDKNRNLLISPASVSLALGMTMNGAKGETLAEMQNVLGDSLTAEQLNGYYAGWSDYLLASRTVYARNMDESGHLTEEVIQSSPVTLANAIWIKDDERQIHVPQSFLQTVADYYRAGAYKAPFDDSTVRDINSWCDENTHHMIPSVIDRLLKEDAMVLANALTFEDLWRNDYPEWCVDPGVFHAAGGAAQDVTMLSGREYTYLDDGRATGFIKQYRDPRYSFAAVLPNADVSLDDYIAGLDGDALINLLDHAESCEVVTKMPEFSFDYNVTLNDALKALGMPTAFQSGAADFTGLNDAEGMYTWIGRVIHKTHIELTKSGTKAAAVTAVIMAAGGAAIDPPEPKRVTLDRPFLFMILDNQTNLPLFLGTVKDIPAKQ